MPGIEKLIQWLGEGSPTERREAAVSLGRLGGGQAVEALIRAPSDATIHYHAMNALRALGPERVGPTALTLLDHPDPVRRVWAAEALGTLRVHPALPLLLRALRSPDARLRRAAAGALGGLGLEEAVEPLLTAAKAEDPELRSRYLGPRRDRRSARNPLAPSERERGGARNAARRARRAAPIPFASVPGGA